MCQKATAGVDSPSIADELRRSLPTPVRRLHDETTKAELWLKDDGLSASIYGGNKVRKLAPLLARAVQDNRRRIVTIGAAGSHHVLATTLFAAQLGLKTMALLTPQLATEHASDTLRCALGAGLHAVPMPSFMAAARAATRLRLTDHLIAPGGMGGLGASGYFDAARELEWQVQAGLLPEPESIVLAAGSGSTAGGLLAGLLSSSLRARLVCVLAAPNPAIRPMILAQAAMAARLRDAVFSARAANARLFIDRSQVGGGYGHPTPASKRALLRAQRDGLRLDHTYTAKAYASFLQRSERQPSAATLFWNTLSAASLEPLLAKAPAFSDLPEALRQILLPLVK